MASPQKENGYTAIANEIMESIAKIKLLGSEFQIILWIIRQTYGFHKKEDMISLTQFEKHTGLSRPTVVKSLKNMLSNKIIVKESNKYKFNKDWETWGSKAGLTSKAVLTRPSKHRLTATSKAGLTHKRKKDTITKEKGIGVNLTETIKKEFMYYYDQDVRQVRKNKYKNKVTEEAKSMLIAVAILWDKMAKSATGEKEVPLLNIYYPIRKCWDKNPDWKYDDFKNLFSHFLNSKIPQEDKISFDLCLSEKYVAKYKIASKNKKETFAGIANELTL